MLDLVRKAQKGNDRAFLTLFQSYEQDIYRIAFTYVKNQNDALDVVQETAYRSFKFIQSLKEAKYFKTWLIRIAISSALDMLRKQKKVVHLKPTYEENISDDSQVDVDVDLELTLQDLLEKLNEDEKSVTILRFYEGLTIKEVSDTLQIPLGSTKTILYRALQKLRKELKGERLNEQ